MFICSDQEADLIKYPYHIRDVHISDPFIFVDKKTGSYFTYVQFVDHKRFPESLEKQGVFYYLESKDLIHWTCPTICFEDETFSEKYDLWAPELHYWKGKYYLISSFRAKGMYRNCRALVADSPRGPFKVFTERPLTPPGWQCLDGTLYEDKKGNPWLVFCHEWLQVNDGQICAVKLKDDLSDYLEEPTILFRASDGPWVGQNGEGALVTDGPFLYRAQNGDLLMLWSSFTKGGAYAISYAKSSNGEITGEWIQKEEPLYSFDGGHGMLFRTFGNELMLSIHCPNNHMKKRILLFEIEEKNGELAIKNEVTGNWYNAAGGKASPWVYKDASLEFPVFERDPRA
jgi:hypothetical protein